MIKLLLLAVAVAFVFGVIAYDNDKVVIDTQKAKSIMEKSKKAIEDNVEIKK
ncbi:hypothetical protein SMGD1_2014 [Sulfurimonas gotlandica GD1]|uniref:Periplasmic protein n=1 Tax=Sulfurimonas gotlandica (strain DSM 19862 / JCM 16533 / GD1) TaxID=929558 RepID=B6BJ22_SULGG|nr:hypothetical protein [Sulfurimonas gotlandica]EDZ63413.1 hypothetical protein CBGD1_1033 [Sulfurimonas gotlandica GD1]EHP30537.1 hypothetical protein SMGD1_2014 [Sulfurimonas gotlandica GD1]